MQQPNSITHLVNSADRVLASCVCAFVCARVSACVVDELDPFGVGRETTGIR